MEQKFCQHCGEKIAADAVICPKCGRQVAEIKGAAANQNPQIVINNNNANTNTNTVPVAPMATKKCDKWVAFLLCLFLGLVGAHKFYEGKVGMGILYIFTGGLFVIGAVVDLIVILCKPNPYYV